MLGALLHIFYVPVCLFLILVVLLQTGKRADLAGAFGGGGSQTAFGARGAATLLTKVTTTAAVTFMLLALALSIMASRQGGTGGSVLDEVPATTSAPVEAPVETPIDLAAQPEEIETTAAEESEGISLTEDDTTGED